MCIRPLTLPLLPVWSALLLSTACDSAAVLINVMGVFLCARFTACKQIQTKTKLTSSFSQSYVHRMAFESTISQDSEALLSVPPLIFPPSSAWRWQWCRRWIGKCHKRAVPAKNLQRKRKNSHFSSQQASWTKKYFWKWQNHIIT